jgi:hypothetical protein
MGGIVWDNKGLGPIWLWVAATDQMANDTTNLRLWHDISD